MASLLDGRVELSHELASVGDDKTVGVGEVLQSLHERGVDDDLPPRQEGVEDVTGAIAGAHEQR